MIKYCKQCHNNNRHHHTQPHLSCGQSQNRCRTKQAAAHISGNIRTCGKNIHQQIANCQGSNRNHSDCRISFDLCTLSCTKKQHRTDHSYRHDKQHIVAEIQHRCNSHSSECHMGQSVPNKGKSLQHQRYPQKRGAKCNKHAYDQSIPHKWILEIKYQFFKNSAHAFPSSPASTSLFPILLSRYSSFVPKKTFCPICST